LDIKTGIEKLLELSNTANWILNHNSDRGACIYVKCMHVCFCVYTYVCVCVYFLYAKAFQVSQWILPHQFNLRILASSN